MPSGETLGGNRLDEPNNIDEALTNPDAARASDEELDAEYADIIAQAQETAPQDQGEERTEVEEEVKEEQIAPEQSGEQTA